MKLTIEGEQRLFKSLDEMMKDNPQEVVAVVTEDVYDNAKKNIAKHSKTGRMENNLTMRVNRSRLEGEVYIDDAGMLVKHKGQMKNYALFVHFGTKKHTITPKNKKALRWVGNNGFAFAKKVEHPGYKGDPFLHKAAKQTFNNLDKLFTKVYK